MSFTRGGETVRIALSPEAAAARGLRRTASRERDSEEKRRLLYKIIDKHRESDDEILQYFVAGASCDLANAVSDAAEKRAVLDAVIGRHAKNVDVESDLGAAVAQAMLLRAAFTADVGERIERLDAMIAAFKGSGFGKVQAQALLAYRDRAGLEPDKDEARRLLDEAILPHASKRRQGYLLFALAACMNERALRTDGADERVRRFDEILALLPQRKRYFHEMTVWTLFNRAKSLRNADEKIAAFEQIVGLFKNSQSKYVLRLVGAAHDRLTVLLGKTPDGERRLAELAASLEGTQAAALWTPSAKAAQPSAAPPSRNRGGSGNRR